MFSKISRKEFNWRHITFTFNNFDSELVACIVEHLIFRLKSISRNDFSSVFRTKSIMKLCTNSSWNFQMFIGKRFGISVSFQLNKNHRSGIFLWVLSYTTNFKDNLARQKAGKCFESLWSRSLFKIHERTLVLQIEELFSNKFDWKSLNFDFSFKFVSLSLQSFQTRS